MTKRNGLCAGPRSSALVPCGWEVLLRSLPRSMSPLPLGRGHRRRSERFASTLRLRRRDGYTLAMQLPGPAHDLARCRIVRPAHHQQDHCRQHPMVQITPQALHEPQQAAQPERPVGASVVGEHDRPALARAIGRHRRFHLEERIGRDRCGRGFPASLGYPLTSGAPGDQSLVPSADRLDYLGAVAIVGPSHL